MFGLQENCDEKNKKRLKELLLRSEEQEARFSQIYKENNISSDEMLTFLANQENFDLETWLAMEDFREQVKTEVQGKMSQVKDPQKTKESYKALRQTQAWMIV